MRVLADRSFVTELLASYAHDPGGDIARRLSALNILGGRIQLVVDIRTVSAFAKQLRDAVSDDILIEYQHELETNVPPLPHMGELLDAAVANDAAKIEAKNYIMAKGGASESINAEILYCAHLIYLARAAGAAILVHSRRQKLLGAVIESLGGRVSAPTTEGTLHLATYTPPSDATEPSFLGPSGQLTVLWFAAEGGRRSSPSRGAEELTADGCRILLLAANSQNTKLLDLEEEVRSIEEHVRMARYGRSVSLLPRLAVRPDDLIRHVREFNPTIVHFSGHGQASGILLRSDLGGHQLVSAQALQRFFRGRGVEVVVFNSCFSREQADAVGEVVRAVVGTTNALNDEAARRFSSAFYHTLCDGHSLSEAFRDGGDSVALHDLEDGFMFRGDPDFRLV